MVLGSRLGERFKDGLERFDTEEDVLVDLVAVEGQRFDKVTENEVVWRFTRGERVWTVGVDGEVVK